MQFGEVYTALQTKRGRRPGESAVADRLGKFYEVQKYLSLSNHVWDGFWMVANGAAWTRLPEDVQAIVQQPLQRQGAAAAGRSRELNKSLADQLKSKGMEVNVAETDSFRAKLREAGFYTTWREQDRRQGLGNTGRLRRQARLSSLPDRSGRACDREMRSGPGRRHTASTATRTASSSRCANWAIPTASALLLVTGVAQSYLSFVRQFSDPALQRLPHRHLRSARARPLRTSRSARTGTSGRAGPTRCEPCSKRLGLEAAGAGRLVARRPHRAAVSGRLWRRRACRPRLPVLPAGRGAGGGRAGQRGAGATCRSTTQAAASRSPPISCATASARAPSADEFAFMLAYNMLCPFEIRLADRQMADRARDQFRRPAEASRCRR